jgi:hypothetical protein
MSRSAPIASFRQSGQHNAAVQTPLFRSRSIYAELGLVDFLGRRSILYWSEAGSSRARTSMRDEGLGSEGWGVRNCEADDVRRWPSRSPAGIGNGSNSGRPIGFGLTTEMNAGRLSGIGWGKRRDMGE